MTDGPGDASTEPDALSIERKVLSRVAFAAKLSHSLESCPGTNAQKRRWRRVAQALDEAHLALTGKVAGEE